MFAILQTLRRGMVARAEERVRDEFAVELIDQHIRDATASLALAKRTLATLVVRLKRERAALDALEKRIAELEGRATEALRAGRDDLAEDAAGAIAEMENERTVRRQTVERIERRASRMRLSVDKAHRRLVALRQNALTARSVDAERRAQGVLVETIGRDTDFEEAERLIERVVGGPDPLEEAEAREEIERELSGDAAAERLGEAGFGPKARIGRDDVLERLKRHVRTDA